MKICFACGEEKPVSEYHKHRGRRDGVNDVCKPCKSKKMSLYSRTEGAKAVRAKFFAEYKERPEVRDMRQEYFRDYQQTLSPEQRKKYLATRNARKNSTPRSAIYTMLYSAAKRRPTENMVTIEDLMEMWERQAGICALSGLQMSWGRGRNGGKKLPNSISLDRIDGTNGYEKDNVRFVCWQANLFKNEWTDAEMLVMARAIVAKAADPVADVLSIFAEVKPKLRLVS